MTIDPKRVQDLFLAALEITDSENRREFLERQCVQDAPLRERVQELLVAHDASAGFGASASGNAVTHTIESLPTARSGLLLAGRYKLIEAIGEGGMGTVWVAEQKEPIRRRVAIKLVKAGMDSHQVLARFEAERQALAMMDHPNIAKVFDGGMTAEGRPFFVMEYVKGMPLVDYCDQAKLSLQDRLELFIPICHAIQHAHQKGILHRDLKPSNILVCLYDGRPVPKVIDFGLAKAMHQALTDQSIYTAHGMMIGTPLYMSPEQAEHNNLDVDTRTDIYSLGVILYELLTGSTPLERQQLKEAAFNEILRLIKDVDPPTPSTRVSSSLKLPSIAAQRGIEPSQLKRSLTGDLDWIVMKALDKERSRRYDTASDLARDVDRFLRTEAVEACPPSRAYRLKKFIRRNRAMVTAGCAVAAALCIGLIGFAWQASVANYQRDQAEVAKESEIQQRRVASLERDRAIQAQKAEAEQRALAEQAKIEAEDQKNKALEQEAEAKKQTAIAEAVAKFQTDMLAAVDPYRLAEERRALEPIKVKDTVTVLEVTQAAVKALDAGSLKDQPLVEAKVRFMIGLTLYNLDRPKEAEPILRKSLAIYRAMLPSKNPDIAICAGLLASALDSQNKYIEAEALYRDAIEIHREIGPIANQQLSGALLSLAQLLFERNQWAEAESLIRESLTIGRNAFPPGHTGIAKSLNSLAICLRAQNRIAEAEPLAREALEINVAAYPKGHPEIADSLDCLATILSIQNKLNEAESMYREVLEIHRATFPPTHTLIGQSANNLANVLRKLKKYAEAESLHREALQIDREGLPANHPWIATDLNNLAYLFQVQGRFDEAEPLYREALEIQRSSMPAESPDIATSVSNLATLLSSQKRFSEAEPLFREALMILRKAYRPGHPSIIRLLNIFVGDLKSQGKLEEATPLVQESLEMSREGVAKNSPELAQLLVSYGRMLLELHSWKEAELVLRESLSIREKSDPDGWKTFNTRSMLGAALIEQKRFIEAEPLLLDACEGMLKRKSTVPLEAQSRIPESLERLADLYTTWHASEPDKGFERKAAQWQERLKDEVDRKR